MHRVQKGQDPCSTEEDRGSGLRGTFPSKGRSGLGVGPVGLEPQGVLGGEGSLTGAGLALPRTPYGPCRSSGRTAAAGPLGCSPSCRAPRRQGRPSGAGLPRSGALPPGASTETRCGGSWLGSRLGKDPHWASRARLQTGLAGRDGGSLGSDLELLVHGEGPARPFRCRPRREPPTRRRPYGRRASSGP